MKILILGPRKHKGIVGGVITHTEYLLEGFRAVYPDGEINLLDTTYSDSGRRHSVYDSLAKVLSFNFKGYDLIYLNTSLHFGSLIKLGVLLRRIGAALAQGDQRSVVAVQFHGGDLQKLSRVKRMVLSRMLQKRLHVARKLRFLTNEQKSQFEALFKVGAPQTERVRNLVSIDDVMQQQSFDRLRVLMLSRFDNGKGVEEFVECAAAMQGDDRVTFYAAGDGPLRAIVEKAAAQLNNFAYVGPVDAVERQSLISKCNVFCLISDYDEGMPYALLENMAAGNIPIVTRQGAMGEIVLGYSAGLVIPKSAQVFRDALCLLLEDNGLAAKLSGCAYSAVKKHFGLDKLRRSLEELV